MARSGLARFRRSIAPAVEPERAAILARGVTYLIVAGVLAGAGWAYRAGFYQALPFPKNTFLFSPGDHFRDLFNFFGPLGVNDPYSYAASVYPPFSYIVMEPFSWIGGTPATAVWTALAVVGLGAFVARQLDFIAPMDRIWAVVVLTVVTYPFLFSFDRGNIEVIVTLLLAGFVWCLQTDRLIPAALLIGAAGAMKGYPILFAALFLIRREWLAIAVAGVTAAALTVLGTIYYGFDVTGTLDVFQTRLDAYNEGYVIGDNGLAFGSSLFAGLKLLIVDVFGGTLESVRSALPIYTAATGIAFIGILIALWRLPLRLWEQITLLTVALIALPTVSADYKLLHLVIPLALFLRYGAGDPWRLWYAGIFVALMVPKAYVMLRPTGVNLGVAVNPALLLALGLLIVAAGIRRARHPDEPAPAPAATPAPREAVA